MFNLVSSYFRSELHNVIKNDIKINIIGELNKLPKKLKIVLKETIKKTKKNKKILVNLAINYGSKKEIIKAINNIIKKKIKLNEENISKSLYTKNIPDPDILIRTGNTKRLSNFLLWQLSYTEIFFSKKLWPEFSKKDYINIINKFKFVKRNYGKI